MKILTIISFLFLPLLVRGQKNDYISFECVGAFAHAPMVIYVSKKNIPASQLIGSFDYSLARLNFIVPRNDFSFIEKLLKSTSKKKFQEKNDNGVIIKIRKNNVADFFFIGRTNFLSVSKNIMSYFKKHKKDKSLLTALKSFKWIDPLAREVKKDYISFDTDGPFLLSTDAIYLSKEHILKSQLVDKFEDTSRSLNYVVSKTTFSFFNKIISATRRSKVIDHPVVTDSDDNNEYIPNTEDSLRNKPITLTVNTPPSKWKIDTAAERKALRLAQDTSHIIIKSRKNKTVEKYFVTRPDSRLMFRDILTYLKHHKCDDDLAMDLDNLNWTNPAVDSLKRDFIEIEYTGDSDKPANVIWISKKPLPESAMIVSIDYDDLGDDYTLHDDEYLFIKKLLKSTKHKPFENDYGGFKITMRENGGYTYFFIKLKNSSQVFLRAISYLKHRMRNKHLVEEFNALRNRQRYQ